LVIALPTLANGILQLSYATLAQTSSYATGYSRGRQPFLVCVLKLAKSMTKFFHVPTKICENILNIVHFFTTITTQNTVIKWKSDFWMYTTRHVDSLINEREVPKTLSTTVQFAHVRSFACRGRLRNLL